MLNLGFELGNGERGSRSSYWEYRVQPGIIDLNHLELVALKRVSKSSWMPHFRLISPHQKAKVPAPVIPGTSAGVVRPPQNIVTAAERSCRDLG
jgi:hypothetical protein